MTIELLNNTAEYSCRKNPLLKSMKKSEIEFQIIIL